MIPWLRRLFGRASEAGEWAISVGQEKGRTVVVRTRTRPPGGLNPDDFPDSVEITWRFDGSATAGMPAPEVHGLLVACEDMFLRLEGRGNGILGLSITGNGRREWLWYVADAAVFRRKIEELLAKARQPFPLEVRVVEAGERTVDSRL